MREAKFRAWDTSLSQMFYPKGATLREIIEASNECEDEWWFDEGEDVLIQFTGLLDKNGTEIYEGDIVREFFGEKPKGRYIVEYDEGQFNPFGYPSGWSDGEWENVGYSACEVIGNIYENKELLDG